MALAVRCDSVLALEQDPAAAARLGENVRRNRRQNVEVREANAFDVLHRSTATGSDSTPWCWILQGWPSARRGRGRRCVPTAS